MKAKERGKETEKLFAVFLSIGDTQTKMGGNKQTIFENSKTERKQCTAMTSYNT